VTEVNDTRTLNSPLFEACLAPSDIACCCFPRLEFGIWFMSIVMRCGCMVVFGYPVWVSYVLAGYGWFAGVCIE